MTGNYFIRGAKPADVAEVTAMWEIMAAQHKAYDEQVWCWSDDSIHHWSNWYRGLLRKRDMVLPVAQFEDGRLGGFGIASCKDNPNIFTVMQAGEIWDVFVHPDYRRHGIGQALMEWTLEALRLLGAEDVKLHVAIANEGAVKLYEKLGMRSVMYRMYKRL